MFGKHGNNNLVLETGYEYHLFSHLNFPILDFMTSFGCPYYHEAEDLLCATIPYDVIKSKMAARGDLKAKIGGNLIQLFEAVKCYFRVFQRNSILDCISSNLTSICCERGVFPLCMIAALALSIFIFQGSIKWWSPKLWPTAFRTPELLLGQNKLVQ